MRMLRTKGFKLEYLASLFIATLSVAVAINIANYGYGGYDLGLLYGAQNMLARGQDISQVPFVLPLAFGLAIKLSTAVAGNTFYAPYLASLTIYIGAIFSGSLLYARAVRRGAQIGRDALIVFTSALSVNLLNPGHIWHSDMTSMIAILILWTSYCSELSRDVRPRVLLSILAALVLLSKQNLAPLYFIGYATYLFFRPYQDTNFAQCKAAFDLLISLTLGALLYVLICKFLLLDPADYLATLRSIAAERGSPIADPNNYLKFIPPEFFGVGTFLSSLRQALSAHDFRSFLLQIARLIWLLGFYAACIFLPLISASDHFARSTKSAEFKYLRIRIAPTTILACAVLSGIAISMAFPIFQRLNCVAVGALLMLLSYTAVAISSGYLIYSLHYRPLEKISPSISSSLKPVAILASIYFMVSYIGLGTNWDLKSADLSVSLVSLFIIKESYEGVNSGKEIRHRSHLFRVSAASVVCLSLISAFARLRMTLVGPPAALNNQQCSLEPSPFWGGKFLSTQQHCIMDREISQVVPILKQSGVNKLFFGPRMETYYSAQSIASPSNLPIWWHPGTSFSDFKSSAYFKNFVKNNYEALIFMKDDFTRMPLSIVGYIKSNNYHLVSCSQIDIYIIGSRFDSAKMTELKAACGHFNRIKKT
jgi:hypothetical protein